MHRKTVGSSPSLPWAQRGMVLKQISCVFLHSISLGEVQWLAEKKSSREREDTGRGLRHGNRTIIQCRHVHWNQTSWLRIGLFHRNCLQSAMHIHTKKCGVESQMKSSFPSIFRTRRRLLWINIDWRRLSVLHTFSDNFDFHFRAVWSARSHYNYKTRQSHFSSSKSSELFWRGIF